MTPVREKRAQTILFVRAVEETDGEGVLLAPNDRMDATRRAVMVTGRHLEGPARTAEAITRRAHVLMGLLLRKMPAIQDVLVIGRAFYHVGPFVVLAALVAGLATNALGTSSTIRLLSFPLLGILAWNLGAYVAMLLGLAIRRRIRGAGAEADASRWTWAGGVTGLSLRAAIWRSHGVIRRSRRLRGPRSRALTDAMIRFRQLWMPVARPLLFARLRRTMHLAAIALMVGVIGGMYLRGLAFDYDASWESTFLDRAGVQALLDFVLGPAAGVLSIEVPDVGAAKQPHEAATWIHLFAMTALLFVVAPRIVLAAVAGLRCAKLARTVAVDFDQGYFRRILSEWRGEARRVDVLPYSFQPAPAAVERLTRLLRDHFGARAEIRVYEPVPYGEAAVHPAEDERPQRGGEACTIVVFNLSQTPEAEAHGELLCTLRDRMDPEHGRLLVLVETGSYRATVESADRVRDRLRAWTLVAQEAGLGIVSVDLERPAGEELLESLAAAIYPPRETAGVS